MGFYAINGALMNRRTARNRLLLFFTILCSLLCFVACASPTPTPAPPPTPRPTATPPPTETPTPSPAQIWQINFVDAYRSLHPEGELFTLELTLFNLQDTSKILRAEDLKIHNAAHLDAFPLLDIAPTWNVAPGHTQEVKWQFIVPPGAAGQTYITLRGAEIINVGEWYDIPEIVLPPTPTPTPADTWWFEVEKAYLSPDPHGEVLTLEMKAQNRQSWRSTLRGSNLTLYNAAHLTSFPALNTDDSWRVDANQTEKMVWRFFVLGGAAGATYVDIGNWGMLYVGDWENFSTFIPMQLELRNTRLYTTIKIANQGLEIELPNTVVDTGMDTIIDVDVAARIGIVQTAADEVYTWRVLGGDISFFKRQVDFVQMGTKRVDNFEILIGDLQFNGVKCLLGSDFFLATGATLNFTKPSIEFVETPE